MAENAYLRADHAPRVWDLTLLRWLWPFARPHLLSLLATLAALLACEALPFLFPTLLQRIIDGPVAHRDVGGLFPWLALYLGLAMLHALLLFAKSYGSQHIGANVIHRLRTSLYSHMQGLDQGYFQHTPAGRLITRLTHDVDTLQSLFSEGLLDLFSALLMLFFAILFMMATDWRLGLATLSLTPLLVLATHLFRRWMRSVNTLLRQELASMNSSLQENLQGMPLVGLFRKQPERARLFSERNSAYFQASRLQALSYSCFFPSIQTLSEFSLLCCYGTGLWLILRGEVSIGTIAAFAWLANLYNRPLRDISDRIANLQNALSAAERIYEFAGTRSALPPGKLQTPPGPLSLEAKDLHFSYQTGTPVLQGISFHIPAGTTTALVGATGSGKSTLVQLVNRFYLPSAGQLRLSGMDYVELDAQDLHRRIATVTQDIFLFAGTLEENIRLGAPEDPLRFASTCARTCVDQIASRLPQGYKTRLREGGKGLSTGERQLLSFARALYADPDLLVLDEATASIDTATEQLVQSALRELLKGRTSLVVAHRLSTISAADQILVLQEGCIVERGTHEDLAARPGHYSQLLAPKP